MKYEEVIFYAGADALPHLKLISRGEQQKVLTTLSALHHDGRRHVKVNELFKNKNSYSRDRYIMQWDYNKGFVILMYELKDEADNEMD